MKDLITIHGAGIGLRRELINELISQKPNAIDFLEIAPENWLRVGGRRHKKWQALAANYPIICHGLSLSLGSIAPLDTDFLAELKIFLDTHHIIYYSEHLSYCSDSKGQMYDLMPIPFTEEAVHYVAARIRQVQQQLERTIAIENISCYCAPSPQMSEIQLLNAVLQEADCQSLLDVNNVYVNSVNHGYNADEFIAAIPEQRIAYVHIAGHYQQAQNLLIDTHGANVSDPVWMLLRKTYDRFGVLPTLLERDNNVPPLPLMLQELQQIHQLQQETLCAIMS